MDTLEEFDDVRVPYDTYEFTDKELGKTLEQIATDYGHQFYKNAVMYGAEWQMKKSIADTLAFCEWVQKEGWQFRNSAILQKHYWRPLSYSVKGETCQPEALHYRWLKSKEAIRVQE